MHGEKKITVTVTKDTNTEVSLDINFLGIRGTKSDKNALPLAVRRGIWRARNSLIFDRIDPCWGRCIMYVI